jgi:hypothetical protein
MMSVAIPKMIINMSTSLFLIGVAIYSLIAPFMTISKSVTIPAAAAGDAPQTLSLVTEVYVDKICEGGVCTNVDDASSEPETMRNIQKTLYALYIITIIAVAALLLLHVMKVELKPWWLTSVIMIILALATLIILIFTVQDANAEFTTASTLMVVALSMMIFKKLFYMGIMH